ncbi:hypothetical protein ACWGJ2_38485 [Streptomyces sp. NPDC054796]
MATETTKTEKNDEAGKAENAEQPEAAEKAGTAEGTASTGKTEAKDTAATDAVADKAPADTPETGDGVDIDDSSDDILEHDDHDHVTTAPRGGLGAGAAAVVSAGLGLVSLTGTSLSEMLRDRKQLIGQIESSSATGGSAGDQVDAIYGSPWHTTAVFNGIFALLAVIVGGVLLAVLANRPAPGSGAQAWVRPVALGGLVLGVLGLLVAGGMYFDLVASAPEVPSAGG